jgi:hypothetical protein
MTAGRDLSYGIKKRPAPFWFRTFFMGKRFGNYLQQLSLPPQTQLSNISNKNISQQSLPPHPQAGFLSPHPLLLQQQSKIRIHHISMPPHPHESLRNMAVFLLF